MDRKPLDAAARCLIRLQVRPLLPLASTCSLAARVTFPLMWLLPGPPPAFPAHVAAARLLTTPLLLLQRTNWLVCAGGERGLAAAAHQRSVQPQLHDHIRQLPVGTMINQSSTG